MIARRPIVFAVLALMTSTWLYTPTAERIVEVRLESGYAQAPELRSGDDLTYRRHHLGIAAEIALPKGIYLNVRVPVVWARSAQNEQLFFHRQTLGDIDISARYRLNDNWSLAVGASFPGAFDTDTIEDSYPQNRNAFPSPGLDDTLVHILAGWVSRLPNWTIAGRGGLATPLSDEAPLPVIEVYTVWRSKSDGFAAGPYFAGRWALDDSGPALGVVGLMERIGPPMGLSVELKLETSVFAENLEDVSGIHLAAVWRQ